MPSVTRRSPYRRTRRLVHALVVLHLVAALGLGAAGRRDAFPFFSWSLFSTVASERQDFAVIVTHREGRALERPLELAEAGLATNAIRAYSTVQALGVAVLRDDRAEAERLRRLLEASHFADPAISGYLLVARRYDPVERWRGTTPEMRPVARFERAAETP